MSESTELQNHISSESKYGFEDNFDIRYTSGWRALMLTSGLASWSFVRTLLGGRWELWWVDPCMSYIWHPVSIPSSRFIRPLPCWSSGPLDAENHGGKSLAKKNK